ncbi:MAG: hypothetical protein L3J41_07570 [Melioribacteraceae bacterium]|nr:hypothetical protein [Melioribacteraceae bacterium]
MDSKTNNKFAESVSWEPLRKGGASFKTHNLTQINSNRIEFQTSLGAKIVYFIFTLFGVAMSIAFYYFKIVDIEISSFFPMLIGAAFAVGGGMLYYFGTVPIVFDKGNGFFWRGRKNPENTIGGSNLKNSTKLTNICAIQIISEYVKNSNNAFDSFELNLILTDSQRLNVIDHSNLKQIRLDAKVLSEFLDIPVWDASEINSTSLQK